MAAVDLTPTLKFYTWNGYRCAYEQYPTLAEEATDALPLLLIHPIGVGLSRQFWHRFCDGWQQLGLNNLIYNPDLLGCGESDKPSVAYQPQDWAQQLNYFLQTVVQKPVLLVVQGALLPVANALVQLQQQPNLIKGIVLSGPPAWRVMTESRSPTQQKLLWNLFFDTPIGQLFWLYARRRQFLKSFSIRQLFAEEIDVDQNWLDFLEKGAKDAYSRYAVFSFLAGFWRKDYTADMANITQPTLVLFGEQASSISPSGMAETPQQRCQAYQEGWQKAESEIVVGRNVLPYESTAAFVEAMLPFWQRLNCD
ncbi:MAG: alpha/beta hydrolase [Microcoleaceae cyanobacterium]